MARKSSPGAASARRFTGRERVLQDAGIFQRPKASPLLGFIGITNWFAPAS